MAYWNQAIMMMIVTCPTHFIVSPCFIIISASSVCRCTCSCSPLLLRELQTLIWDSGNCDDISKYSNIVYHQNRWIKFTSISSIVSFILGYEFRNENGGHSRLLEIYVCLLQSKRLKICYVWLHCDTEHSVWCAWQGKSIWVRPFVVK